MNFDLVEIYSSGAMTSQQLDERLSFFHEWLGNPDNSGKPMAASVEEMREKLGLRNEDLRNSA